MPGKDLATTNPNAGKLVIDDAQIMFRNFAGKEGQYNREGDRNFCLMLDPAVADEMREDGWNVKQLRARDEGDEPRPYIQVSVSYKNRPPNVTVITSKGRTRFTEDEVEILDWVDIAKVDVVVRPYNWNVNGNSGIKAYMQSIYIIIEEDPLDLKYSDVPYVDIQGQPEMKELEAGPHDGDGDEDEMDDVIDAEIVED